MLLGYFISSSRKLCKYSFFHFCSSLFRSCLFNFDHGFTQCCSKLCSWPICSSSYSFILLSFCDKWTWLPLEANSVERFWYPVSAIYYLFIFSPCTVFMIYALLPLLKYLATLWQKPRHSLYSVVYSRQTRLYGIDRTKVDPEKKKWP